MFFKSRQFDHLLENGQPDQFTPEPPNQKTAGLFWGLVSPLLGTASTAEPDDPRLAAMRSRELRLAELNAPAVPVTVEPAEPQVAPTKIAVATAWLIDVLKSGPLPEREIQALARTASITPRNLKRAKQKLKVRSIRKGRRYWVWALLAADPKNDGTA